MTCFGPLNPLSQNWQQTVQFGRSTSYNAFQDQSNEEKKRL